MWYPALARSLRGEPHHHRFPEIRRAHRALPPARPDQLVIGGGQRRRQVRCHEQLARQVAQALHERWPATWVVPPDAAPLHRRPDLFPARCHRASVNRPANGHVPVPDESIQVHPAMMARPRRPVIPITRRPSRDRPACRTGWPRRVGAKRSSTLQPMASAGLKQVLRRARCPAGIAAPALAARRVQPRSNVSRAGWPAPGTCAGWDRPRTRSCCPRPPAGAARPPGRP